MESVSITYQGSDCFRHRIILSVLSSKTIKIEDIRSDTSTDNMMIGITDYEVTFLKLIEAVTNGTVIQINDTGTSLLFRPGVISGGKLHFDCPKSTENCKPLGYYLEMLLPLAPFSKNPFHITLTGISYNTVDDSDPYLSIDMIRIIGPHILSQFGLKKNKIVIQIEQRGWAPNGQGKVIFSCPILPSTGSKQDIYLNSIQWKIENGSVDVDSIQIGGKIKRIRGIVVGCRISPIRLATRVKNLFGKADILSDVQIHTDFDQGPSPGLSLILIAETVSGALFLSEGALKVEQTQESLADHVVERLLYKIERNQGCTMDPSLQWLYLLLITLSSEDVSMILCSSLSNSSIQFLRDLRKQMGMTFRLKEKRGMNEHVEIVGVGQGFRNYSIRST